MGAIELVALPLLALALTAAAVVSWRRHLGRTKLLVALTALVVDAGLWLAALEPPIGPHPLMTYVLVLVNLPFIGGLIYQVTGFQMNPPWTRPYDDSAGRAHRSTTATAATEPSEPAQCGRTVKMCAGCPCGSRRT